MSQFSRREVLQGAAAAAVAVACGKEAAPADDGGHAAYAAAVGSSVDVVVAEAAAGPLRVLEVSPRRTLTAPGVGRFDSYSVLFSGPPLPKDPSEPVVLAGAGLGRQAVSMLRVDRPAADGTVFYQAAFNVLIPG